MRYETAHDEPTLVIDRKLALDDGLFYVAIGDGIVVGSNMAGYDDTAAGLIHWPSCRIIAIGTLDQNLS